MVGYPSDGTCLHFLQAETTNIIIFIFPNILDVVRQVILGNQGVLEGLRQGGVVVDMTTSQPSLAKEIYDIASKQAVHSIDAPVSGRGLIVLFSKIRTLTPFGRW